MYKICATGNPKSSEPLVIPIPETAPEKALIQYLQKRVITEPVLNGLIANVVKIVPFQQWIANFFHNSVISTLLVKTDPKNQALNIRRRKIINVCLEYGISAYAKKIDFEAPDFDQQFRMFFLSVVSILKENERIFEKTKKLFLSVNVISICLDSTLSLYAEKMTPKAPDFDQKFRGYFLSVLSVVTNKHLNMTSVNRFVNAFLSPFFLSGISWRTSGNISKAYDLSETQQSLLAEGAALLFQKSNLNTGTKDDVDLFQNLLMVYTEWFSEFDVSPFLEQLLNNPEDTFGLSFVPCKSDSEEEIRLTKIAVFPITFSFRKDMEGFKAIEIFLNKYLSQLELIEKHVPSSKVFYPLAQLSALFQNFSFPAECLGRMALDIGRQSTKMTCSIFGYEHLLYSAMTFILCRTFLMSGSDKMQETNEGVSVILKFSLEGASNKSGAIQKGSERAFELWREVLLFFHQAKSNDQTVNEPEMRHKITLLESLLDDICNESFGFKDFAKIFCVQAGRASFSKSEEDEFIESFSRSFSILEGYPKPIFWVSKGFSYKSFLDEMIDLNLDFTPKRLLDGLRRSLRVAAIDLALKSRNVAELSKLVAYSFLHDEEMLPLFLEVVSMDIGLLTDVVIDDSDDASAMPEEASHRFSFMNALRDGTIRFSKALSDSPTVKEILSTPLVMDSGDIEFVYRAFDDKIMHSIVTQIGKGNGDPGDFSELFPAAIVMNSSRETLMHFAAKSQNKAAMLQLAKWGYGLDWEDSSLGSAYTYYREGASQVESEMRTVSALASLEGEAAPASVSEPKDLKEQLEDLRKNRKLQKQIQTLGFMPLHGRRGKGSHQVFKNELGEIVVVPHGPLKTGTARAILKQAGSFK